MYCESHKKLHTSTCPLCLLDERDKLKVEVARLQGIVDDVIKKIVFKCPSCLSALKHAALQRQDWATVAEYSQLLDDLQQG